MSKDMNHAYILNEDHTIRAARDIYDMEEYFKNTHQRIVGKTRIKDVEVSTVFLGFDQNFSFEGPPVLFETMIFRNVDGGEEAMESLSNYQTRCCTWEEALVMHEEGIQFANEILAKGTA